MKKAMEMFNLLCTLSVTAHTTVKAESLEAAIELAKDRDVVVELGDEDVVWVAREIMDETPEDIREEPKVPLQVQLDVKAMFAKHLRDALRELPEPNERDYDVQDPGSFARAREDYQCRVAELQRLLEEFQAEIESLMEQRDAAER